MGSGLRCICSFDLVGVWRTKLAVVDIVVTFPSNLVGHRGKGVSEKEVLSESDEATINGLPADILRLITQHVPCQVHWCVMPLIGQAWKKAIGPLKDLPVHPQLPMLLRPESDGPTFSCLCCPGPKWHHLHHPPSERICVVRDSWAPPTTALCSCALVPEGAASP